MKERLLHAAPECLDLMHSAINTDSGNRIGVELSKEYAPDRQHDAAQPAQHLNQAACHAAAVHCCLLTLVLKQQRLLYLELLECELWDDLWVTAAVLSIGVVREERVLHGALVHTVRR